jgi:aspartyl-tRNA(Asn)/glutamyl-tRNA(Gln) amidotransferase subunit C
MVTLAPQKFDPGPGLEDLAIETAGKYGDDQPTGLNRPTKTTAETTVDRSDIEALANLARLTVNEDVIDDVAASISSILTLVDQLQAVNTDDVEPMSHPQDGSQRLRRDEVSETDERESFQAFAPQTEGGLYLVPKVIE